MSIPNDLVFEILTWLPAKQLARCKCVCKPWRSMIGSRPFSETYRSRQRGLILLTYWPENSQCDEVEDKGSRHLRFYHCPLRRPNERSPEKNPLYELKLPEFSDGTKRGFWRPSGLFSGSHNGVTQFVDGLICVGERVESSLRLSLLNVGTGEMMGLPEPEPVPFENTFSTYHLGYDSASRVYKLLRMIFNEMGGLNGAQIMNLNPPSSGSELTWRLVDLFVTGVNVFHEDYHHRNDKLCELKTCPDQAGTVFWTLGSCFTLLSFNFSFEKFLCVKPPLEEFENGFGVYLHASTLSKDDLTMWYSASNCERNAISCYRLEDFDKMSWRRAGFEISQVYNQIGHFSYFVLPSTSGDMLVMDRAPRENNPLRVYSYSEPRTRDDTYREELFFAGKLPVEVNIYGSAYHGWECLKPGFGEVFCLIDENHLHLPLECILGGAAA